MSKRKRSQPSVESLRSVEAEEKVVENVADALLTQELAEGEPKEEWSEPKKILGADDLVEETKVESEQPEGKPVRYWHEHRVFDCPSESCPFDALEEKTIQKHYDIVHKTPEAPPRGHLVLTDRHGNIQK